MYGLNILISVVVIILTWVTFQRIKLRRKINKLPGPKTRWPFGNCVGLMKSKYEDLDEFVKTTFGKYADKPLMRFWVFYHPTVIILKASSAEVVLRSSTEISKHYVYTVLDKWLGKGLLTSTGSKWAVDRKTLTPCFHFQILNTFMDIFNEKSLILISKLNEHMKKEAFDVYPYITLCALDIICDAAMGKNINAQSQKESEYVKAVSLMSKVVAKRVCFPWFMLPWFYNFTILKRKETKCLKILHDFTNNVIKERREDRKLQSKETINNQNENSLGIKKRVRFLDLLLEMSDKNAKLTDDEIREQVDTFMFEGHDTTSCSLAWTLYFLGRHPQVQEKTQEEIDQIFGKDKTRDVTSDDLVQLKYLEAVMKESLRMVPVVPMYGRRMEKDLNINGFVVPKGVDVSIMSYFIHHDPEIYEDPYTFNPERFLVENKSGRHPYSFLAFSAGPRNCIGQKFAIMEEKVVLSHIIRNFNIISRDKQSDVKIGMSVIAKPLNGIFIQLLPR